MRSFAVMAAINLVIDVEAANGEIENSKTVFDRVTSWYDNTDVTDPEILAACALMGKSFYAGVTYADMLTARDYWFPHF